MIEVLQSMRESTSFQRKAGRLRSMSAWFSSERSKLDLIERLTWYAP